MRPWVVFGAQATFIGGLNVCGACHVAPLSPELMNPTVS